MKKGSFLVALVSLCITSFAQQSLEGAWSKLEGENNIVLLLKDGYFTSTEYSNHAFINSWGGPYIISNSNINIQIEFDAQKTEETGTVKQLSFSNKNGQLIIKTGNHSTIYTRLDDGKTLLAGVWKITSRE